MSLLFFVVFGSAMLGWLGGGGDRLISTSSPTATLAVRYQPILRSGNWFETLVSVRPDRDVADLAVSVSSSLWQEMSIDTLVPDAESSKSIDGRTLKPPA